MVQPPPEFATDKLRAWLDATLPHPVDAVALEKFSGGQSNPTYRLTTNRGDYVLRRKPFGTLLPKAHMIEREARVLQALGGSDVPVPRLFGLCDDASVIGAPFYVMELIEGRIFWDPRLPEVGAGERGALFDAMGDAVAKLHGIDVEAVGLSDFGRSEGFLVRQVALWTAQYRAAQTAQIDAMERLIDWLPQQVPVSSRTAIFHGDLRFDNLIFHPSEPRVLAILDWELATIGDPLADFAYNMLSWHIPPDLFRGLGNVAFGTSGIPDEKAYFDAYCRRMGLTGITDWPFYLAFGFFRLASILQGVARRALDGNASAADAAELGARAAPLAEIGWRIAAESR